MPRFSYNDMNFDLPPVGVYLAQVTKAEKQTSQKGNTMIALSLRTIPDGYSLRHFLVFNGTKNGDGLLTQFCKNCEGELTPPSNPDEELSLTAADCLHRICFVDVMHEGEKEDVKAKIKFAGILARAKALARAPELASIPLPANVPPPRDLASLPKEESVRPSKPSIGALSSPPDDDIPFARNYV
jgi:hypothetical protein